MNHSFTTTRATLPDEEVIETIDKTWIGLILHKRQLVEYSDVYVERYIFANGDTSMKILGRRNQERYIRRRILWLGFWRINEYFSPVKK